MTYHNYKSPAALEADEIRKFINGETPPATIMDNGHTMISLATESAIKWYQSRPYTTIVLGKINRKVERELRNDAIAYVKADLVTANKATGFLSSFLISWLISSIAKWVITQLLKWAFTREQK